MGKIILGGGGDEITALESHKEFYNSLGESKSVLYIPIAIDPVKHPFRDCKEWIAEAFKDLGKIQVTLLTELKDITQEEINKHDGIFIGGGNTYRLMKLINDSDFSKLLIGYYNNGGVIFGGSAGAVVFGKDINIIERWDENEVGLEDTRGMNMLREYSVFPHFKQSHIPEVEQWIKKKKERVLCIPEDSWIILENGELVINRDDVTVYNAKGLVVDNKDLTNI